MPDGAKSSIIGMTKWCVYPISTSIASHWLPILFGLLLQAAAVDDNTARDLIAARLVREPEPAGFGTLLAHSEPRAAKASTAAKAAPRKRGGASAPAAPDDRAARAQLREAKKALGAAEAEERQAKRRWAQTQRDLEKARAAVDKAQRELDRLHGR